MNRTFTAQSDRRCLHELSRAANNVALTDAKRIEAIYSLLDSPAILGCTLKELGLLLDEPTWLLPEKICEQGLLSGQIPVDWMLAAVLRDSIIVVEVAFRSNATWPPPLRIYLRVSDDTDELIENFRSVLLDKRHNSKILSTAVVQEVGFVPKRLESVTPCAWELFVQPDDFFRLDGGHGILYESPHFTLVADLFESVMNHPLRTHDLSRIHRVRAHFGSHRVRLSDANKRFAAEISRIRRVSLWRRCLDREPEGWDGALAAAHQERSWQCDVLRDCFGFWAGKPIINHSWLTWNHGTVFKLAQDIEMTKSFADLPILADVLEEAGCTRASLLSHCRDRYAHPRGKPETCWVVNLLLNPGS